MGPNSEKLSDSTPTGSIQWGSSWPELESPDERTRILGMVEDRFGIPTKSFDSFFLFKRRKSWWLMRKSPHLIEAANLKVEYAGIKAFHKVGRYLKPTTRMIQCFGSMATKAVVDLSPEQVRALAAGQRLNMDLAVEPGYVILRLRQHIVLGVGLWYKGMLVSQIPKKELRSSMTQTLK